MIVVKNILIVLINNKKAISGGVKKDIRYDILVKIGQVLKERNLNVYISPCNKGTKITPQVLSQFELYKKEIPIDFLICWSPVLSKFRKHHKCSYLSYENGHLSNSVIIDPQGLLEKSKYNSTLNYVCELNYDKEKCLQYLKNCQQKNLSKRVQPKDFRDIPKKIFGKYIFIPTQFHKDISLKNSKLKMMDCVKQVMKLCKKHKIPLVVKIHPHIKGEHKEYQENILKMLKKKYYEHIYVTKMSINILMKKSLFTVTLNGSTIMDNFINQTPVLVLLKCLYSNTDAVIYDDNLKNGFIRMLTKDYDLEHMLDKQRKIVWWYLKHNLSYDNSPSENISILEKHFQSKLRLNQE